MKERVIAVERLTKRYRQKVAVDDLSFTVEEGSLFAFLGTNGAGKSTTISCITTLLDFDSGRIRVGGKDVGKHDHAIRAEIGIVFQLSLLDPRLTVRENLESRANFYGIGRERTDELIALIDMQGFQNRPYGVLSGGEKRRSDIARALLHSPGTLFLDEPTTGLDPQSRDQVWSVISQLRSELGLTVLLTTHYMAETESADRVLVIDHGRSIAEGTPFDLRAKYSSPHLTVSVRSDEGSMRVSEALNHVLGAEHTTPVAASGGAFHLDVPDAPTALAVIDALRPDLVDFEFRHGSMDDVFLTLTTSKEKS